MVKITSQPRVMVLTQYMSGQEHTVPVRSYRVQAQIDNNVESESMSQSMSQLGQDWVGNNFRNNDKVIRQNHSDGDLCQVLRIRRRICTIFQDPDPFPGVLGSGSINYSNKHKKINWKGKFNKVVCLWLGPVGPTDKENQVEMLEKYCFKYITSLKR